MPGCDSFFGALTHQTRLFSNSEQEQAITIAGAGILE
uniref:Uncharacterized protein n=1 Tax=Moniliophthora roreri TaxID=221103 RepID=A0A0W0FC29_MONRR